MGPVWDFNITFGIGDYCEGSDPKGWGKDFNSICGSDGYLIHFWWAKMWENPKFRQKLVARYQALRAGVWSDENMIGKVDSLVNVIGEARYRNFQRWPVIGQYVWPNSFVGNTYTSEVNFMKDWLLERLAWMDINIQALQQSSVDPEFEKSPVVVYPNPTDGMLYVKTDAKVFSSWFSVELYDQVGKRVFENQYIDVIGVFKVSIPVEKLATGIYTYVITDHDRKKTYREQVLIR
jgi:CotH kinase protein/Secretion system C-terminal sorting domain